MTLKSMLAGTALASIAWAPVAAEDFQMQTFLSATAATTVAFEEMAAELAETTDGEINITVLPGGAVVGAAETIEAIQNGILDGQYTAPSYFAGSDPAMGVLGDTIGAYPDSATRDRWFTEGGGLELARALYEQYDLYFICPIYWPSEQIPSTVPINTVADFEGLSMRAPGGLASDLLSRAGASLVTMGVGESVTAMETGVLDATDLANVALNVALGMHNQAKYSVLARHSMAVTEMSVSLQKWNGLSADSQQAFEDACNSMSARLSSELPDADAAAQEQAANELDVTFLEFGEEEAAIFRALTQEVWADWGSRSPNAQAIVYSHQAFLSELGLN
ncbi:MAG: TRAP transporter substrate-binding protein DctP [Rhizobiales bacterium]|nr:TRAP transporter substrate-binding protein DctP [Hyphomicrobiales bacterium]MBO6698549.1 TRAP transporter substrate-binding protein DctP [Hyphomicrobiales bacterium]MBO6735197.1 TRAP transporter substrate-binding protein DctP [Hyphomicrobiales bacterium]MBO6910995.1 TRAP transporter substrate-binding protein DctP [Hyphomicrobiales bacterium]MBO6957212.1 TRAP transporter substrate-binding protein DctP [Hyphomicrobiales bacterium]